MADSTISAFPGGALTGAGLDLANDFIPVVDVSVAAGLRNKRMVPSQLAVALVTAATIASGLGYTPANAATLSALSSSISAVGLSGAYADLTGKPSLATVATTGAYADLTGKPSLATVATTGAYADLTGKPSLATVATSGAYADLTGKPSLATIATSGSASDLSTGTVAAGRMPALTGDVTTTAGAVATTLATVNSNVGTFGMATVTVNGKGLVTAASAGIPTGTGFIHITSGAVDGAARAIDLASADVTGSLPFLTNAQTSTTYTIASGDKGGAITFANSSAVAVSLPQATGSFGAGWSTCLINLGPSIATITPNTSTIDGLASIDLMPNSGLIPISDGSNYSTFRGIGPSLAPGVHQYIMAPTVDGTATGPVTYDYNAGYTTAVGDAVYLDSSATWQKFDADAESTAIGMPGIALEVKTSGNKVKVALPGATIYSTSAFPTFTVGGRVYLSGTAGAVTQTAPTATDSVTRCVGWGAHADKLYFFPAPSYVVHT